MKQFIYEIKNVDINKLKREMPLDQWFYELVQKKVTELTILDVSRMLRQNVFLDIAIPAAWNLLSEDPLCGEMYEGQLVELLTQTLVSNSEENKRDMILLSQLRSENRRDNANT